MPGISELIIDNDTGYLSEGLDVQSLAFALERSQKNTTPDISQNARNHILRKYSLGDAVEKEASIFLSLMKQ